MQLLVFLIEKTIMMPNGASIPSSLRAARAGAWAGEGGVSTRRECIGPCAVRWTKPDQTGGLGGGDQRVGGFVQRFSPAHGLNGPGVVQT